MAKLPGTPASTGLIHMPLIPAPGRVEYVQIGGFGPCSRRQALEAAKIAGLVGHSRPGKVWVQRPKKDDDCGEFLLRAIQRLKSDNIRFGEIFKESDAKAGFGIYYMYYDKVVMEHTSDPESKVIVDGTLGFYPHVHIEVVDYADIANSEVQMSDRIKKINNFKIYDDTGYSPSAVRLTRLGVQDPSAGDLDKPKFNHHIYYYPEY
jgi:hypothetical protein